MKKKYLLSFVFGALLFGAMPSYPAVTGRVIDGSGNPVADAMVTYTNIDNRLIYVYTCTDGRFSIPAPTDWSIKNLPMYNYCTGVQHFVSENKNPFEKALKLSTDGTMVRFNVGGTKTITVNLYAPDGRKIGTVFSGVLPKGNWQFDPVSNLKQHLSHQLYLVQVSDGATTQSMTMVYTGKRNASSMTKLDNSSQHQALPKLLAAVDSLRAGKTGYAAVIKGVDSYSANAGDFTITLRDIEAEIAAIMNGKSTTWKAQQVTQGIDYNSSDNWGTTFYGVGNGGAYAARADQTDGWQNGTVGAVGVPKLIAIDAVHGFISPPGGTIFPHNIGMGCTRIPELCEIEERITAIELRAMGINWAFAPDLDIVRNERHGRTYEGWDEGPDGTVICAKAAIRGFQGTDLSSDYVCAATAKHYAGAGGTNDGTHGGNAATGTDAVLRAIHLPQYKAAVDNGAATVMAAFNSWLGTPMHQHKVLLTDVLKTSYNFDGFIVGDWMASQNSSGGLAGSFAAGVDNMMNPENPTAAYNACVAAAATRLDDACKRILRVKLRMNLMQNYLAKRALLPSVASTLHKQVARECVRRSVVLLKNDAVGGTNVLPLGSTQNIHVIGNHANSMSLQCGGWTLGWPTGATATTPPGVNIRTAIDNATTGTVTYATDGNGIPASADVVVVVFGEQPYAEGGGDAGPPSSGNQPIDYDNDTRVAAQRTMLDAAKNSGKPVVGILVTGRPLIITNQIAKCNAFVCAWLIGTEGDGLADILFSVGGEKPTAKLSHTWPSSYAQIPININNPATNQPYGDVTGSGGTPLFPYGYGLTY
jgi:beta-glucosidase-like glycosyl hydrolase